MTTDAPPRAGARRRAAPRLERGAFAPEGPCAARRRRRPATVVSLSRKKKQSGFQGNFFASSYFTRLDAPTGEIESDEFPLEGERMRLLVGGGDNDNEVGVELLVGGESVRRAAGQGADGFNPVWWDIRDLRGKQARLHIYDRSQRPMGHILVDDIQQYVKDGE